MLPQGTDGIEGDQTRRFLANPPSPDGPRQHCQFHHPDSTHIVPSRRDRRQPTRESRAVVNTPCILQRLNGISQNRQAPYTRRSRKPKCLLLNSRDSTILQDGSLHSCSVSTGRYVLETSNSNWPPCRSAHPDALQFPKRVYRH